MKLIFDKSVPGRSLSILPPCDVEETALPEEYARTKAPLLPELSETDVSRHYTELCHHVYGVNCGFYPLGSCTMKYNPRIDEEISLKIVEKRKKARNKCGFNFFKKISSLFYYEKPFFTSDLFFNLLFSLFISFSLYTGSSFLYKDDLKGLIFIGQFLFYGFCLGYSLFLSKRKEKKELRKGENIILIAYLLVGISLGNLVGCVVATYLFNFDDIPLLIVPLLLSFAICICILPLLNLVCKAIEKRKK